LSQRCRWKGVMNIPSFCKVVCWTSQEWFDNVCVVHWCHVPFILLWAKRCLSLVCVALGYELGDRWIRVWLLAGWRNCSFLDQLWGATNLLPILTACSFPSGGGGVMYFRH
jgi:hypothetical protein